MDEKEYRAFNIPKREERDSAQIINVAVTAPKAVPFNDSGFAEIEFEFDNKAAEQTSVPLRNPPVSQPISQRVNDPIREKFYEMRRLASSNPFAQNDAALFYKQARFMEDFTDDYPESAKFSMFYPCYQQMGYEQLRTYFTWRAKVRGGEFLPISTSYIFLYIYELLANIGVEDADDGLGKITEVWLACRGFDSAPDGYVPRWLKDYHIYYSLPHSFAEFVRGRGLAEFYPESFLFGGERNNLEVWNLISSYDITKSKFYTGNEALICGCFDAVLDGLKELCAGMGMRIEELFSFGVNTSFSWYPFPGALFLNHLNQPDRTVELPGGEVYICKDNRWTGNTAIPKSGRKELVGYLIKKTEQCLRTAVKYKHKITVNTGTLVRDFMKLDISFSRIDAAIERAVEGYYKNLTRTVVAVDHGKLAQIREEALGTLDKLLVPEYDAGMPVVPLPKQILPSAPADGWAALKAALSEIETQALAVILRGAGIKAFAGENNVMPEVLADGINEKAADCIGDSILEMGGGDEILVFDEYKQKLLELVK